MTLIPLRAGPLALAFDRENAALRYIFAGPHEILRGISAPVRDAQWLTIRPEVTDLDIVQRADGFCATFQARCRSDAVDFRWRGAITGNSDGTLGFDFDGEALRTFARNRIGFCVLHPAEAAGRPLIIEHTDGRREVAQLPSKIAPHQPFFEIRALTHEFAPGLRAEVRLEGDTFEMEDQRNWTDASFKTYCTSLALPHPVTLPTGMRIRQRVTMRLLDPVPSASSPFTPPWIAPAGVQLEIAATPATVLPPLGVQWRGPPTPQIIAALRPLRLAHLRVDIWLGGPAWGETLREGAAAATLLDTALELAVLVGDHSRPQLIQLREALATLAPAPRIVRWIVFHENEPSTPCACIIAWREVFAATPFAAPVGGGATNNFTELNRGRDIASMADFTVHACNPQMHAFDDRSLIETLAIQGATVVAARRLSGGRPSVVSPVTLTPRCTTRPTVPLDQRPAPLQPFRIDERLATPFAAAWTLGSFAALASAGAASFTYFEACGPNGLLDSDGGPRPVHRLFELLAPFVGARVCPVTLSDSTNVTALALELGDRHVLIAATFSDTPQVLRVTGAWGKRELTLGPHCRERLVVAHFSVIT